MTDFDRPPFSLSPSAPSSGGELSAFEVAHLCRLVRERTGVALESDKAYVVHCRLNILAMAKGLGTPRDIYRALSLNRDSVLVDDVVDTLLTKETSFFRNPPAFRVLNEVILPALMKRSGPMRIWSAGCSTGQEPYSVAMMAREAGVAPDPSALRIRATDFSASALEKARSGRYSQLEVSRGLPTAMAVRYMRQEGHEWRIDDSIAGQVDFSMHNLLDASGYRGIYDLILCRNVLIYFEPVQRDQIIGRLLKCLAAGGYLLLGASECSAQSVAGIVREQHGNSVFYRAEK